MTATYYDAKQVYSRNYGSERLYKRSYCNSLLYTEGVMDFQKTLNAYWVVDNMVSYIPTNVLHSVEGAIFLYLQKNSNCSLSSFGKYTDTVLYFLCRLSLLLSIFLPSDIFKVIYQ